MNSSFLTLKMPPIPGVVGLSFDNQLLFGLAAVLLLCRVLTTLSSLWAGAEGGLLTPGLANGALMAVLLGCVWNMFWPGTAVGAFAIVGATAFLASLMQMSLTAVMLTLEFTRVDHHFLVPILLAVAGSMLVFRAMGRKAP